MIGCAENMFNQFNSFWEQKIPVKEILKPRLDYFVDQYNNKKILHVGCVDYPFYDLDKNFHMQLYKTNKFILDGCDIDEKGIKLLKENMKGNFYLSFNSWSN